MNAKMVDISRKPEIYRAATATGKILLKADTIKRIRLGQVEKGNPLQIATVAGINASKLTSQLMPLCHPLRIEGTDITTKINNSSITVTATVNAFDRTGVEMEALTVVTITLLNIWDVTKQYEKTNDGQYPSTSISGIKVVEKVKRNVVISRGT